MIKKILLTLCILGILIGCTQIKVNNKSIIPIPIPIAFKPGIVDCSECCGTGKVESSSSAFSKFGSKCKVCNGRGKMEEIEPGVLEPRSQEYIRGFEDYHDDVEYEDSPYLLRRKSNKWKEGWKRAEELD